MRRLRERTRYFFWLIESKGHVNVFPTKFKNISTLSFKSIFGMAVSFTKILEIPTTLKKNRHCQLCLHCHLVSKYDKPY